MKYGTVKGYCRSKDGELVFKFLNTDDLSFRLVTEGRLIDHIRNTYPASKVEEKVADYYRLYSSRLSYGLMLESRFYRLSDNYCALVEKNISSNGVYYTITAYRRGKVMPVYYYSTPESCYDNLHFSFYNLDDVYLVVEISVTDDNYYGVGLSEDLMLIRIAYLARKYQKEARRDKKFLVKSMSRSWRYENGELFTHVARGLKRKRK